MMGLSLDLVCQGFGILETCKDSLLFSFIALDLFAHLLIKFAFIPQLLLQVAVHGLLQAGCLFKLPFEFLGLSLLVSHAKPDGRLLVSGRFQLREY